jgi:hypothetical protein
MHNARGGAIHTRVFITSIPLAVSISAGRSQDRPRGWVQEATAQGLNDGNAKITALKQQLRPMEQKHDETE